MNTMVRRTPASLPGESKALARKSKVLPMRSALSMLVALLGLLLVPFLPLSPESATLRADTVYLTNGSAIDGVVLGKHEGMVILQIGNLGKMEIPEKEIVTIEKNARTGPVNPERGDSKKEKPIEKPGEGESGEKEGSGKKSGSGGSDEKKEIDPELKKEIEQLVYDLTRQRSTVRTRAESKLIAIGDDAVPFVRTVAGHASEQTRIAAFRILKKHPQSASSEVAIGALTDANRFVRKLAWETLQEISGENWVFPWDDSATDRERESAKVRWTDWWKKEQARLEEEAARKKDRD